MIWVGVLALKNFKSLPGDSAAGLGTIEINRQTNKKIPIETFLKKGIVKQAAK